MGCGEDASSPVLDRCFHGVCPHDADPRNANIAYIGPLEERAMSAVIDVEFVVQVILDATPAERQSLLERRRRKPRRKPPDTIGSLEAASDECASNSHNGSGEIESYWSSDCR